MLRRISTTAFLGTLFLATSAFAAEPSKSAAKDAKPSKPAADDQPNENAKPATPPAATGASAAEEAEAAPGPVDVAPEPESAAPKAKKRTIASAGMNTQSTTVGGVTEVGDSTSEKDWGFKFKGFFRAPMRVGIDNSHTLSSGIQFHAIPVLPDGNYTRWSYTNLNPGPWAELMFQYGNQRVMMTTSIASYNLTTGGWRELQDQLGIDRAFLTLKFPEALGDLGGLAIDVGIFQNAYGAAGKYDAGQYETYLIGRTRMAGVTATADLDVGDDFKLIFEGGGGAKTDQQYQRYACSGDPRVNMDDVNSAPSGSCEASVDYPTWMAYPGDKVQQGTNLIFHIHAGAVIKGILTTQLHYINSFVRDARWNVGTTGGAHSGKYAYWLPDRNPELVPGKGSIQVIGWDAKLNGGWMGDGYLGISYLIANNPLVVNDSIEVLHSQGGWQLEHNFFKGSTKGNILSIGGQYTFSLAAFMMRPRPFWGQATDITIRPFFMFNKVGGTDRGTEAQLEVNKLKVGLDTVYSFSSMMAAALRLDAVMPDTDHSAKSFYVFAPRLIFRSEFVTHESVVLQYSYYKYGSDYYGAARADLMPWPFDPVGTLNIGPTGLNMKPDKHVVMLYANMWW
jgi:hypothetical protein